MAQEEGKITIKELAQKLKEKLLCITNLNAVYIGKTQDMDNNQYRHGNQYDKITHIATGTPKTICKAEDYLIKTLTESFKSNIKVDNINKGSGGNNKANMIYVCLDFSPKSINELDDDDLFDKPFILIDE